MKRFDGEWPARFEDEPMAHMSLPEKEFPVAHREFAEPIIHKGEAWRWPIGFARPTSGKTPTVSGACAMRWNTPAQPMDLAVGA